MDSLGWAWAPQETKIEGGVYVKRASLVEGDSRAASVQSISILARARYQVTNLYFVNSYGLTTNSNVLVITHELFNLLVDCTLSYFLMIYIQMIYSYYLARRQVKPNVKFELCGRTKFMTTVLYLLMGRAPSNPCH